MAANRHDTTHDELACPNWSSPETATSIATSTPGRSDKFGIALALLCIVSLGCCSACSGISIGRDGGTAAARSGECRCAQAAADAAAAVGADSRI